MECVRDGIERIARRRQPNPPRAGRVFTRAQPNPLTVFPCHHLSHFGVNARLLFRRQFRLTDVVLLEKITVVHQDEQLLFGLNKNGELWMGDEQFVADMEHGVVHVVRAHDQLRSGFHFLCNPRDHVPFLHHVFLLFGRGNR